MAWNKDIQTEAEQNVLGSMLIDESIVRYVLVEVDEMDFYLRQNRIIYRAIRRLFQDGRTVDPFVLADMLQEYKNEPWRNYLAQLIEITPTSANWHEYAKIMREQAVFCRLEYISTQLQDTLQNAVTLDDCRPVIASLAQTIDAKKEKNAWSMLDLYHEFLDRQDDETPPEYIRFGFASLDSVTYPKRGNVVIIGAEPDVGKTAFGLQTAYFMAQKFRVGYFTIDTEREEIGNRTIASSVGVSYTAINRRELKDADAERIAAIRGTYTSRNMMVLDAVGYTVPKIQAMSQIYGFDVIFIDYVQQVIPENTRANRTEQMASVSRALKNFARSTQTMVVELAQIQRPDKTAWKEPNMHSVKECGQFEQDADLMLMLFRPDPDKDKNQDEHRFLKIVKNKKGKWGKWPLFFDGDHQKFEFMTDRGG